MNDSWSQVINITVDFMRISFLTISKYYIIS